MDTEYALFKITINKFLKLCKQTEGQSTTKGLNLREVGGTFRGFEMKAVFGSGNLITRPGLVFLKDGNQVSKGIYPLVVFVTATKEVLTIKGVSTDNQPPINMRWVIQEGLDAPLCRTKYADERSARSYLRGSYSIESLDEQTILSVKNDIESIIADYRN